MRTWHFSICHRRFTNIGGKKWLSEDFLGVRRWASKTLRKCCAKWEMIVHKSKKSVRLRPLESADRWFAFNVTFNSYFKNRKKNEQNHYKVFNRQVSANAFSRTRVMDCFFFLNKMFFYQTHIVMRFSSELNWAIRHTWTSENRLYYNIQKWYTVLSVACVKLNKKKWFFSSGF